MTLLHRLRRSAAIAVPLLVILGLWFLAAYLFRQTDDVLAAAKLPYPSEIVEAVGNTPDLFLDATWTTLSQSMLGLAIGTTVAVTLSVLMIQARWAEASIMPYLLLSQMVPIICLVPILQSIFQSDTATRLAIASLFAIFTVSIAMVRGLKSAPAASFDLMRSYGAGRVGMTRYVQLPVSLPMLFTGLRVAAPLCVVGSIVVDLTGGQNGLGFLMLNALSYGPQFAPVLWASTVIALLLGLLLVQLVLLVERLVAPWAARSEEAAS